MLRQDQIIQGQTRTLLLPCKVQPTGYKMQNNNIDIGNLCWMHTAKQVKYSNNKMTCSLTAAVENEEYNVHAFLRGAAGKCQYHAEHSASGRFCDSMDDYGHL